MRVDPIHFGGEEGSNAVRDLISRTEPLSLRTFTPSQAVLSRSAGIFHWTPEGRRLYDYSSGVLVANLGHNPRRWLRRLAQYMEWTPEALFGEEGQGDDYVSAVGLTAYNAITELEAEASRRLLGNMQACGGGGRMQQILWAASGSEAVQKAIWCSLKFAPDRDVILATRHGFHGKKGLAGAVTGSETDPERDPRVRFIGFPRHEIDDLERLRSPVDLSQYAEELEQLAQEYQGRLNCLITEPYLGGGGIYHPPAEYLQLLQDFCRKYDVTLILDEVQANFGRTGHMYAFESYGIEPDIVCLGKGLGNGIPVSAAVGRADIMTAMGYGAASDTWSANPIACAAVLATLDEFENTNVLEHTRELFPLFAERLQDLKETGAICRVRGEGMVFGIECADVNGHPSTEVAVHIVEHCYRGENGGDGIHLLGALAGNVLRISPPMTITRQQAEESLALLKRLIERAVAQLSQTDTGVAAKADT